ncbi:ArsR/SmtB family transcription factor [Paraburkholderia dilworthii]|uniref:Metalloregulator ArsR/SmtB family transcription factor n=1 Tax=Paraburkholderia dilworthii TaxID=948106 RepID=A0ABW9DG10_9BURK
METNEDAKLLALSAIAHRSRLAIFRILVGVGPRGLPAGEISGRLGIARSSLSFHLKDMSRANLVSGRREGTFIYYAAALDTIHGVIDFLTENCLTCPTRIPPPDCEQTRSAMRTTVSPAGAVTKAASR